MNAWVSGPVGRSALRSRRQIPDVGPTPYLPVEWFGVCSGSYFYPTEEEAREDSTW